MWYIYLSGTGCWECCQKKFTWTMDRTTAVSGASSMAQWVKETQVRFLSQEDPLEEKMATHSSILAWKIPRTEKPGRLHSMELQRVGHSWAAKHRHSSCWYNLKSISLEWSKSERKKEI